MTAGERLERSLVAGAHHVGRRRHQPTAPGVLLIVAGVALTPLALRSSDRVPIGVLVGLLVLILLDSLLARRRIGSPVLSIDAPPVTSSLEPIELVVEVTEPAGELLDIGPTGVTRSEYVSVPGSATISMAPTRWGVFDVWTLRVAARGPLGLGTCARWITHRPSRPTAALPPPAPHAPLVLDAVRGASDEPAEVAGLREGRAGAPLRDLHWPTVARTGRLVVREREPVADLVVAVVVSLERWTNDPSAPWDGSDAIALARTAGAAILAHGGRIELHGVRRRPLPPGTTLHADHRRPDARSIGVEAVVSEIADVAAWSLALAELSPQRGSFDLPAPPFLLVRSDGISWERER